MDPDAGTLNEIERDLIRARSRLQVADLDNEIDGWIAQIVGKLSRAQHKAFQAARIAALLQATPEAIITRRAILMNLTDEQIKALAAPDILTAEELAALVVIMTDIAAWLSEYQEDRLTYRDLIRRAQKAARDALALFQQTYHRTPQITDVPESLMTISRARKLVKLPNQGQLLLPFGDEDEDAE
jgi:hypothetical protein